MEINKTIYLPKKIGERLINLASRVMVKEVETSVGQRFALRKGPFSVSFWVERPVEEDGKV